MCDLSNPIYHDKDKAREHLEAIRWPDGPICPHCGVIDNAAELKGKAHRPGVYKCRDCRKQFSVTVGTVFERSHIPLNKWLLATHLLTSSKKGISSHQLHRNLGVTYKTAWFMTHRIRCAMESTDTTPLGSGGGTVEADETYIGRRKGVPKGRAGGHHKQKVFALVERGGKVKSMHISGSMFQGVKQGLKSVSPDAHLMTDEASMYKNAGKQFASHETVNHGIKEWKRGNVSTNTVEGYFSIFKRGMKGVYQHCNEDHLHRYLAEFDFRYNNRVALKINDKERARLALQGIGGKRLTYRRPA
jgi:transposase-like protein